MDSGNTKPAPMPAKPTFARVATVDLDQHKLFIDGVEFPWRIARDGTRFAESADTRTPHTITITLFVNALQAITAHHAAHPEPVPMSVAEMNAEMELWEAKRKANEAEIHADTLRRGREMPWEQPEPSDYTLAHRHLTRLADRAIRAEATRSAHDTRDNGIEES